MIVLFLDIDGVLNQYDVPSRIRRKRTKGFGNIFDPFPKKVQRLAKLVKKYNLDVYVFSAWTIEDLEKHLPFKLKGDTKKWVENMNEISEGYTHSILVDDEVSAMMGKDHIEINPNIITLQPNWNLGMCLKDYKELERILKGIENGI